MKWMALMKFPSWNGEKTYTITRTTEELKKGIQPVRIRAGLPDYDVYGDPNKFRIKVKRERQIELFAEGHRYFDLRRWCDAPLEEALPIYGCNIYVASSNPAAFHTPVETPSLPIHFYYQDVVLAYSLLCNEAECANDAKSRLDISRINSIICI